MKTLLTLALTISLSGAFSGMAYANSKHQNKVTTGSAATTGSQSGTFASDAPPVNDTVGTGQSSTLRKDRAANDCVDSAGRVYAKGDVGYSSCRAHMRAK